MKYAELYPDDVGQAGRYCAPRLDAGPEVEAVRRRIALRAGIVTGSPHSGGLRGFVDEISQSCIRGWAQNVDHPEAPVCLDVLANGRLIGRTLANGYREDTSMRPGSAAAITHSNIACRAMPAFICDR